MYLYRNASKYIRFQCPSGPPVHVHLLEAQRTPILHLHVMLAGKCKVLMAGAGRSGRGSRKRGVGTQQAQVPGSLSLSLPPLRSKVLHMAQDPLNWPLLLSGPRCPLPHRPSTPRIPQPWSNSAGGAETRSPCGGQRPHPPGSCTNVTCAERLRDQHHPLALLLVPLGFSSCNWTPAGVLLTLPSVPVLPASLSVLESELPEDGYGRHLQHRERGPRLCRCSGTPVE